MDTLEATLETDGDEVCLRIGPVEDGMKIILTHDNTQLVKHTFNRLLSRLKSGSFQVAFSSDDTSLFSFVAKEYIDQLNRELNEVFQEMERHGLTKKLVTDGFEDAL